MDEMDNTEDMLDKIEEAETNTAKRVELIPVTIVEEEIKEEKKDNSGYDSTEKSIIESSRRLREKIIADSTIVTPRGKDLEAVIQLINSQEDSAHKTANMRLKVKTEDTNSQLGGNLVALLSEQRRAQRKEAMETPELVQRNLELPDALNVTDMVYGETSLVSKSDELNVDDFWSEN